MADRRIRGARLALLAGLVACAALTAYQAERARAAGIPSTNTLYYTGSLLTFGQPDNTSHNMSVALYITGETGSSVCNTSTTGVVCVDGQFSIALPAACVPFIHANPAMLVQVTVDGTPLGMTPLAAVPYAVEADTASNAAPGSALANLSTEIGSLQTATAAIDIVTNGSSRNWADGTYARSCYFYLTPPSSRYAYAGATGTGVYTVQPDGPGGGNPAFSAYCDMTNQGGGWTLVANISGADNNHLNISAVNPSNLLTPSGGEGKLADIEINNLRSGISPAYRLNCAAVTGYFPKDCEFVAVDVAAGACSAQSYVYPVTSFAAVRFSQPAVFGLADGSTSTNDRLIWGDSGVHGCDTAATSWGQSGNLYVR